MENCCKTKKRDAAEQKALTNRLSRIEGQVRGIKKMVEEDAYCVDIITQVSAVESALASFSRELLETHIKECVVNDIKADKYETVDELVELVERLMR